MAQHKETGPSQQSLTGGLPVDALASLLASLTSPTSPTAALPVHEASGAGAAEVMGALQDVAQELLDSHASVDTPLMEAGLDSLGAVEFRTRLRARLGESFELPETLAFDFPTLRQVETHLSAQVRQTQGAASPAAPAAPGRCPNPGAAQRAASRPAPPSPVFQRRRRWSSRPRPSHR